MKDGQKHKYTNNSEHLVQGKYTCSTTLCVATLLICHVLKQSTFNWIKTGLCCICFTVCQINECLYLDATDNSPAVVLILFTIIE